MFPINSQTVSKDIHSGTFGLFEATSTTDRIIHNATIFCSQNKDNALTIGYESHFGNDNNLIDTEGANGGGQILQNRLWENGKAIYWSKEISQDTCHFTITYSEKPTTTPKTINYNDWLFATGTQIFFISFIAIGILFGLLTPKK